MSPDNLGETTGERRRGPRWLRHAEGPRPVRARSARAGRLGALLLLAGAIQATPVHATDDQTPFTVVGAPANRRGVVTWGASAERMDDAAADRGYRLVVHTSTAGSDLRIRLSNAFGDRPVTFDSVYAGRRQEGARLVPGSNRRMTFDGAPSVTVPAGAATLSDPLPGRLPAATDLVVSIHSPDAAGPATGHWMAMQTSYTTEGDHTAEESAAHWTQTTGSWFYLDAVSVRPPAGTAAVVALGDSITDGSGSSGRLHRWPDVLADRVPSRSVVDEGIAGNKVLSDDPVSGPSVLHRLDRDVLSQPGLRTVIMLEGINDLRSTTPPATAAQIIAGYRQVIARVHARGARILGATITPVEGSARYDAAMEQQRQAVNGWIRTSHAFDGVVDFASAVADPADPLRLLPSYDSGDHLHPDNAGYQAMGEAVDLTLLR